MRPLTRKRVRLFGTEFEVLHSGEDTQTRAASDDIQAQRSAASAASRDQHLDVTMQSDKKSQNQPEAMILAVQDSDVSAENHDSLFDTTGSGDAIGNLCGVHTGVHSPPRFPASGDSNSPSSGIAAATATEAPQPQLKLDPIRRHRAVMGAAAGLITPQIGNSLLETLGEAAPIVAEELADVLPQLPEEDEQAEHSANAFDRTDTEFAEDTTDQAALGQHLLGAAPFSDITERTEVPSRSDWDSPDKYPNLFGYIPPEATDKADDRFIQFVLQHWALQYFVPLVALTALLGLFHGVFGRRLGLSQPLLSSHRIAHTLHEHANEISSSMRLDQLFKFGRVDLPDVPSLKAPGSLPYVEYVYAEDWRKNVAAVLMKSGARFYYDPDLSMPEGFVCADAYRSNFDRVARSAAIERAQSSLLKDIEAQIPGTHPSRVGLVAVGLNVFSDSIQMHKWTQSTSVTAITCGITNLHRDVAESAEFVALCGLMSFPKVIRADKAKAATGDTSVNASPETLAAAARVESVLYEKAYAVPLLRALTRGSLIVSSSSLQLPAEYPYAVGGHWGYACLCQPP